MTSRGAPLCNAGATMKVRLATADEAVVYRRATSTEPSSDTDVVYLVDLDA